MNRARWLAVALAVAVVGGGTALTLAAAGRVPGLFAQTDVVAASPAPVRPSAEPSSPAAAPGDPATVYVHYYLWWTTGHWADKLGPAYPYASTPLPGTTDSNGCNPSVSYAGSQIVDVPTEGLYDQSQAATFALHVQLAHSAGLKGFLADWQGVGTADQTPASSGYNSRLDLLVRTVDTYDAAHGAGFGLGLAYAAFGDYKRPAAAIIADLKYFASRYADQRAFANPYSSRPIVMWLNSRKFSPATIRSVSVAVRPYVYLVGDETAASWKNDAEYLDASSYYWSTQDPWNNPRAGTAVTELASEVHADGKRWFAPFIAGYDKQILGGTCVARRGTATLAELWRINGLSDPDGWFGISWNEFVENTYLEPTKRYGSTYLDALAALIRAS